MLTLTKKEKLLFAILLITIASMVSGCAGTITKQGSGTAIGAVTGRALAY